VATGATHTDFHRNLQYFSNEQNVRWDNRAKQARAATCVFPTLALVLTAFAASAAADELQTLRTGLLSSTTPLRLTGASKRG
jgi:hypothetical protein